MKENKTVFITGGGRGIGKEMCIRDSYNTLIVSPPGRGKTTILRDLIRNLSNGIDEINFKGRTCGVVDERGEDVYKRQK